MAIAWKKNTFTLINERTCSQVSSLCGLKNKSFLQTSNVLASPSNFSVCGFYGKFHTSNDDFVQSNVQEVDFGFMRRSRNCSWSQRNRRSTENNRYIWMETGDGKTEGTFGYFVPIYSLQTLELIDCYLGSLDWIPGIRQFPHLFFRSERSHQTARWKLS